MATVTLEHVNKVYDSDAAQVAAVSDVSLAIADREFIVLVGPSGCGKSTTLRMVAGLEDVTSGMIRIAGRVMNNVAPKDRDIAMVFQNYALYPHMTVYKNMAFGLRMRRFPKAEIRRRVDQAAELLGIGHLLDRKPKQLSGGERQRVAVGRAIVREPRAFLFDEPLSNLDAKLRIQMRAELKKLHRRLQTTVIYVTHDQEEAMTLGDRIVVMKSGVVHQCDTPLEVYERPRDRFVASFVGTPAMNFFEGRMQVGDGEVLLETGSGVVRLPQRLGERLAGRRGEPFVLGVRSEGLSFSRDDDGAGSVEGCANRWRMGVAVVEPLGSEKDVHLQACDGVQAVARVPSHVAVAEGNDVDVFLDASRMHVFEPGEAGLNIGLNGYGAQSSVH